MYSSTLTYLKKHLGHKHTSAGKQRSFSYEAAQLEGGGEGGKESTVQAICETKPVTEQNLLQISWLFVEGL